MPGKKEGKSTAKFKNSLADLVLTKPPERPKESSDNSKSKPANKKADEK